MFKLAIDAGHFLHTAGNRIPKDLDPKSTSEWELNDRVARYVMEAAADYEDVEVIRVDDVTGQTEASLSLRCRLANEFGADFYLSVHHNAGIGGGKGGGLVAYSYQEGTKAAQYRDAIYAACVEASGLKGDRWDPTQTYNFYVCRHTVAPAVLMEYGFMDSVTDVPVILSEDYARKVGKATMEAIARVAGLKRKEGKLYRVQVGAFRERENASALLERLKEQGFEGFVLEG